MTTKTQTSSWNVDEYLQSQDDFCDFLAEIFGTGDPALMAKAISAVARANGLSAIAERIGISTEVLERSLSEDPVKFVTIAEVIAAVGLQLEVRPKSVSPDPG